LGEEGIAHPHVYTLGSVRIDGALKLYAGTEPPHLYESDDVGESWHELPGLLAVPNVENDWSFPAPPHIAHVKNIAFDPWDTHVMYVCVEQGGVYRSTDGGEHFEWLSSDIYADVHRLVINPTNPNRLYVPGGDGLYGSRDGGQTWTHLTNRAMRIGYPDGLVMHPRLHRLMFMAGAIEDPHSFERDGTPRIRASRAARTGANTGKS
jgi:photosystem II stability/assembly factor-like uncharacterized protein